jgi:hypothetical protein
MIYGPKFKRQAADIMAVIKNEGKCASQIAIECEITNAKLRNYISYLRHQRLIYICGYKKLSTAARPVVLYKSGCQEDVEIVRKRETITKPKPYKHSKWPRCDEAAAWMLNPINHGEDVCQS